LDGTRIDSFGQQRRRQPDRKWDGTQKWAPLSSGMSDGGVNARTAFDDGTGGALYAEGGFTTAGDVAANYITACRCAMP
jgi:hypothetical protein